MGVESFFAKVLGIPADSCASFSMLPSDCNGLVAGREKYMKQIVLCIWKDERGQDLIEYALMAGFVAVAAGAIMPTVSVQISQIFSKVSSVMTVANSQ
jgi:pilus assembly protein Flp/PilA